MSWLAGSKRRSSSGNSAMIPPVRVEIRILLLTIWTMRDEFTAIHGSGGSHTKHWGPRPENPVDSPNPGQVLGVRLARRLTSFGGLPTELVDVTLGSCRRGTETRFAIG